MKKTFKRVRVDNKQFQLLTLPGTNLFKFEIVNKFGANIERLPSLGKNVYGLSHLIEHLGFRATRDFPTAKLMELLKSEGSYNASTDHDRINYWFKTVTENADIAIRLVCNYALNDLTNIPEDEFETEKKVVYNEAKRYADDDQTMFHFNTVTAACDYHPEDNVIGIPETIDTFTLFDAIVVKERFLACGEQVYNVTYDPMVISEEEVLKKVVSQLDTFTLPDIASEEIPKIQQEYNTLQRLPQINQTVKIENESEQAMTSLILDTVSHILTANRGNLYLGHYAVDTSLNDVIREQHGLTYGISLYEDNISYCPFTFFSCDVSRGTEDKLMELFKESVNKSVDAFSEDAYNQLNKTVTLKRTMRLVNQENYDNTHWTSMWYPYVIDQAEEAYAEDIDAANSLLDEQSADYVSVRTYLEQVRDVVNNERWCKVTN